MHRSQTTASLACLTAAVLTCMAPLAANAQRRRRHHPTPPGVTEHPAATTGRLDISSTNEGAEIYIDEELRGHVPTPAIRLDPGEHTIRVTLPGYTEFSDVVRIRAGATAHVEFELIAVTAPLHVGCNIAGAQVLVDGRFVGTTPLDTDLLEGRHVIRVRKGGYYTRTRRVVAVAGRAIRLDVRLVELPPDENPYAHHPPRRLSWYEKPLVWVAVGGAALAIAGGVALGVALSGSTPAQSASFCESYPRCVALSPPGY